MSIITFTVTKQHLDLIRNIDWKSVNFPFMQEQEPNEASPFNGDNLGYDVGVILFGKSEAAIEPNTEVVLDYTADEKAYMKKIYEEIPITLSIVCQTGKFEPGTFQTSNYVREWVKID